jgi:hypothetical protein
MWKYAAWFNVFVYCKFLKLLGHIMVLLVLSIVGFTWYAVVPATYGPMMISGSAGTKFGSSLLVLVFSWLVSAMAAGACKPPALKLCACHAWPSSSCCAPSRGMTVGTQHAAALVLLCFCSAPAT